MIVVKVEMWPRGDESRAKEFARAIIGNDVKGSVGTGGEIGNYSVELRGGVWGREDLYSKTWRRGGVLGFERKKYGAWHLIYLAIGAAIRRGQ